MGSGAKRKSADQLRINKPVRNPDTAGGAGGEGGGAPSRDINNVCPMTMRVKVVRGQDVTVGTKLVLEGKSLRLAADTTVEVGTIPTRIFNTIRTCLSRGIKYPKVSVVADKQGARYAELSQ